MKTRVMLAVLLSLGLVACGDDESPPTLTMTADTATIAPGGTITLSVATTNFELEEHHESAPSTRHGGSDTGHLHVYLDDLMTEPVYMGVESTIVLVEGTTVGFDALPGEHELIGRLHAEDHKILMPEVISTVSFTVE